MSKRWSVAMYLSWEMPVLAESVEDAREIAMKNWRDDFAYCELEAEVGRVEELKSREQMPRDWEGSRAYGGGSAMELLTDGWFREG